MTDLIERVRQRLYSIRHERVDANPQYVDRAQARAAVAEVLDAVAANLSAVQYNPAPYTAMKARLAAMRKEALGDV